VIANNGRLDFDALQLRIHPAESRVRLLAKETPASIVFFDLLCEGALDLRNEPFERRRERLQKMLSQATQPLHLTPATSDSAVARDWFQRFEGAGLDGVIAKSITGLYESDKRLMLKVKHVRECVCVVGGFRWHKNSQGAAVGSLLLGLFDDAGALQHVGVCASFTDTKRRELVKYLAPYRKNAFADHPWKLWAEDETAQHEGGHRLPGGQSRWSHGKDLRWEPVRPELVVEVAYDHMQGDRFRHVAQFRRWRSDKKPRDCSFDQLEVVTPAELKKIFATGR
jgi:ATP-dependent DNA ligase